LSVLVSIFTSDILPIFIIAGVGFVLARFVNASVKTLARIVFNALAPCLVFNMLVTANITGTQVGQMALFCILLTAAMGVVARLVAGLLRLGRAELIGFLLVVMFSNAGNYALPVVLFAFGLEALSQATVYFVTSAVLVYTVGVFLAATGQRSVRRAVAGIAKVPAVYGVAAALIVLTTGVHLPLALSRPITLLSDAALPMMILVLGMQLERAALPDRPAVVAAGTALSLLVSPALAFVLAWALGLSGPARQAAIVEASMPAAVVTTILALEFDVSPALVTSVVFTSTLLSPFTLTLLLAYLTKN
jgi:hypothetical protein